MRKNNDGYIEDYLFFDFRDMAFPDMPRDLDKEQRIARACRLEFCLQEYVIESDLVQIFGSESSEWFHFRGDQFSHLQQLDETCRQAANSSEVSKIENLLPTRLLIRTPLVNLYRLKRNIPLELAVNELEEKIPDGISRQILWNDRLRPFQVKNTGIHNFCFLNESGMAECLVCVEYSEGKKIILPSCKTSSLGFFFSPYIQSQPLFNKHLLAPGCNAIVVLTDSIELASANQFLLERSGQSSIVWVSWLGEDDAIDVVDWTPLNGHQVYFLLKEHSDFHVKEICRRAFAVGAKLNSLGIELRYVSYLHDSLYFQRKVGLGRRSPIVVTEDQVKDRASGKGLVTIPSPRQYYSSMFPMAAPRKILFSPLIRERTVTLLYGAIGTGKTTLAMSMGLALSQGAELFDRWKALYPASVLYLHVHNGDTERIRGIFEAVLSIDSAKSTKGDLPLQQSLAFAGVSFAPNVPGFYGYEVPAGTDVLEIRTVFAESLVEDIIAFAKNEKAQNRPMLIVFDGFQTLLDPSAQRPWNIFLNELKNLGAAILFIPANTSAKDNDAVKMMNGIVIDSVVKVEADLPLEATGIAMMIRIEKGFQISKDEPVCLNLELDPIEHCWKKLATKKRSMEEDIALIKQLKRQVPEITIQGIANRLGIFPPMVKKRLRQLRGLDLPHKRLSKRQSEDAILRMTMLGSGKKKGKAKTSPSVSAPARDEQPNPPDGNLPTKA